MRVLHLNDRISARGGADWHLLGVLRAQVARWGAERVWWAGGRADASVPRPPCTGRIVGGLDAREARAVELEPLLREARPQLVHLHNVVNPFVLEWAAASSLPVVMTVQDHRAFCPGRGKWRADGTPCLRPLDRARCAGCHHDAAYFAAIFELTRRRLRALRQLPALTVLSHYMKQQLVQAGLQAHRVHVIPPFVHGLQRDAPASGPPCALFVGRLVSAKGVWEAVQAHREAGLRLPLVLAGTGSLRGELRRRAPGVEAPGWVEHRQLSGLYRRARVVLLPCRWQEPFGIVGLEALWMGVPVAAWDSGGVREWHPGPGLVPWGDCAALARAAGRLAGKPAAPAPGFEEPELMQRLERLYLQLLGGRR